MTNNFSSNLDVIAHYGKGHNANPPGRGSGRFAWGSGLKNGKRPQTTNAFLRDYVDKRTKQFQQPNGYVLPKDFPAYKKEKERLRVEAMATEEFHVLATIEDDINKFHDHIKNYADVDIPIHKLYQKYNKGVGKLIYDIKIDEVTDEDMEFLNTLLEMI